MNEIKQIKLTINEIEIEVPSGATVLQACEEAGVEIPRFCYHEKLSVAGNCRMCLVEMERSPKPIASCAMPASEGMVIRTNSEMVEKARKGVMEFLLINHPLDCPICDQGGECDLQDQALYYGKGSTRFEDNKRAVSDKNMGPLIKTTMTRCIHCTRCVRFANEIAGVEDLGAVGRGENVEITTYLEKAVQSELSGNLVDLCPVGALTSKPYAFIARPWELNKVESIDVMDALGSNIRIDSRDGKVLRVLPRLNESINEEWISDKTRYAIDGLSKQRLDCPYLKINGKLSKVSWDDAFSFIKENLNKFSPNQCAAIIGNQADNEAIFSLRSLFQNIGSNKILKSQCKQKLFFKNRSNYLFNSKIDGLDKCDFLLLVGANTRLDAAVLNARIRKNYINRNLKIASISSQKFDLTFDYDYLGPNPDVLNKIINEEHFLFDILKKANYPMIIIGDEALTNQSSLGIQDLCIKLLQHNNGFKKDWNGYNILHTYASSVGSYDLLGDFSNFETETFDNELKSGLVKLVYLLGADEFDYNLNDCLVIYQGHHGDNGAQIADVILPGCAYTEKDSSFLNIEGKLQFTQRSVFPPGDAKEDWSIIRALSEKIGKKIQFDSLSELRKIMLKNFSIIDSFNQDKYNKKPDNIKSDYNFYPLEGINKSFFMSCPISRSSSTMAKCELNKSRT